MKTKLNWPAKLNWLAAALCALVLPTLPLVCSGCHGLNKATYQAAQGSAITVDAAMTAWGRYVSAHHPPVETEQKVKAAYDDYVRAAVIVADAGIAYNRAKGANSADVGAQQAALESALKAAADALNGLVDLLRELGVKL